MSHTIDPVPPLALWGYIFIYLYNDVFYIVLTVPSAVRELSFSLYEEAQTPVQSQVSEAPSALHRGRWQLAHSTTWTFLLLLATPTSAWQYKFILCFHSLVEAYCWIAVHSWQLAQWRNLFFREQTQQRTDATLCKIITLIFAEDKVPHRYPRPLKTPFLFFTGNKWLSNTSVTLRRSFEGMMRSLYDEDV